MADPFGEVRSKPVAEPDRGEAPQDPESSQAPQTTDMAFTRILYITPHQSLTNKVKIHDLTNLISASSASQIVSSETEPIGKSLADATPLYAFVRNGWWQSISVYQGDPEGKSDSDAIATWKPSRGSWGKQEYTFPASSPHSSHTLSMKHPRFSYSEIFVQESVQYIWKFEARSIGKKRRPKTLWKKIGDRETAVARFQTPYRAGKTGGTLIVNEEEVDVVVAFLTCCGMLRKIRQRR